LLRLKNARTEKENVRVLERLVEYPRAHQLDFPKLVQLYLRDKKLAERFYGEWKRRNPDNKEG
jgi:hypothetical protein